jgi:DNA-binding beta-propeller fold protein YncE
MSGRGTVSVIDPRKDAAVTTINAGSSLEYAAVDGAGKLYVNGASTQEIVRIDTATNTVTARWPVAACQRPHGLAIDVAHHRLFASCVNSVLTVVNTDTGNVVATVPIGQGTDAAAFDPVRGRMFSSNGRDGTITVIQEKDPDTYVPLGTVATAVSARTMGLDPSTGSLYVVAADIAKTTAPAADNGRPARPSYVPGSTKLLILDPVP